MIHVAVVADSPVIRAGLVTVLGAEQEFRIETDANALDGAAPGGLWNGLAGHEALDALVWAPHHGEAREIARWYDDGDLDARMTRVPTIVLLEHLDTDVRRDAYAGGASAVLPLDVRAAELIAALRAVANGFVVMQPAVSLEMAGLTRTSQRRIAPPVALTPRELEVLTLLARGLANKGMALELGITEHTVKTHVAAVYEKLGTGNRAEAVVAAARQGLIMI